MAGGRWAVVGGVTLMPFFLVCVGGRLKGLEMVMERSFLGLTFLCTSRVGRQSGIGNKALFCSWILVVMPRMDRVSVVGHYFFFSPRNVMMIAKVIYCLFS